MKCVVCGTESPVMEHHWFKGTKERPEKEWSVYATLYYKSNEENTACIESYCSCKCAYDKNNLDNGVNTNEDRIET